MKKNYVFVLWAIGLSLLVNATYADDGKVDNGDNYQTAQQDNFEKYVPKNWKIVEVIKGELNNDEKDDIVLRIDENNPKKVIQDDSYSSGMIDSNQRGMMIFLSDGDTYSLAAKNVTGIIPSKELFSTDVCIGDPLESVKIKNKVLTISFNEFHSCGISDDSSSRYVFRYQNHSFELIGYETNSYNRKTGAMSTISVNFSTKKKAHTVGKNMFEDKSKGVTTWQKIKIETLYRLQDWNEDTDSHILEILEQTGDESVQNVSQSQQKKSAQRSPSPIENDCQEKQLTSQCIAQQLNSQGYRQYKNGNYVQALRLFRRAVVADENYALAHYNLACTTAIALDRCLDEIQEDNELLHFVSRDTIFSALEKSIKLDPKRLERSKTDTDLADIRKTYRYNHEILGYDKNDDAQLQMILHNVDWQSTGMRLYHTEPAARLIFHKDGRVQVKITHLIEGDIPDNSLPWKHTYKNGQYYVKNGLITLKVDSKTIQGTLNEDGTLTFPDAEKNAILPTDSYRFSRPDCFSA